MPQFWIGSILGQPEVATTYYGLINGPAFYIPLIISSLAAGGVSEKYPRTIITNGSIILWSGLILLHFFAQTFVHTLILRVFTGFLMGFFVPSAISLILDYFPPKRQTTAIAVFGVAE